MTHISSSECNASVSEFCRAAASLSAMLDDHPRVSTFMLSHDNENLEATIFMRSWCWFRKRKHTTSIRLAGLDPELTRSHLEAWVCDVIEMLGD